MLQFQHNYYLFFLFLVIPLTALFLYALQWKASVQKKWGNRWLVQQLIQGYSAARYSFKFMLLLVCVVATILALANLRKPVADSHEKQSGIDIVLAMDVSKSLWAQDVQPSRLDKAKQCMQLLIDKLANHRIGFVVFTAQALQQMPLTTDIPTAHMFVSLASPNSMPVQGTNFNTALQVCNQSFSPTEKKYKAIVLFSDGETHTPLSQQTIQLLQDAGVVVFTVGVGTTKGSEIKEVPSQLIKTDKNGKPVISTLHEEVLQQLAQQTHGAYWRLSSSEQVATQLANELNNMEKKAIETGYGLPQNYTSYFPFFIAFIILLLIIEFLIPERKNVNAKQYI